ncbi:uncharacterized protein LOC124356055 isoform X2 [Homalodisca vitripennis]|uniref:uncharacterized protein LOC124356055 isoform X2 n=1 Tax=Homalodisca vitripennis TaxID=197043 RepID=UPI001EECA51F|nr:uncharacterized protein LOC124356055 isoform X2 [Homalodisca vitripennis]
MSICHKWRPGEKTWSHSLLTFIFLSSIVTAVSPVDEENVYPENKSVETLMDVNNAPEDEIRKRLCQFGVHYNIESIMDVLKHPDNRKEETVYVLLVKYEETRQKAPVFLPEPRNRHPIISIDGFFTHGRTKIAKMVATALFGRRILMPTRHVARLRTYFADPAIKKHYYSLSKYMGAHLAMSYSRSAPVVLERYWHDQASYVMAKSFEGLIPENSSLYEFPKDLLVPDVMFFVNGALNQNIHNETTAEKYAHNDLANKSDRHSI